MNPAQSQDTRQAAQAMSRNANDIPMGSHTPEPLFPRTAPSHLQQKPCRIPVKHQLVPKHWSWRLSSSHELTSSALTHPSCQPTAYLKNSRIWDRSQVRCGGPTGFLMTSVLQELPSPPRAAQSERKERDGGKHQSQSWTPPATQDQIIILVALTWVKE